MAVPTNYQGSRHAAGHGVAESDTPEQLNITNKLPQTEKLINKNKTKQNSHSSRGWNSELRVQACLVRVLFWVTEFLCPHVVEGARDLSGVSFLRH